MDHNQNGTGRPVDQVGEAVSIYLDIPAIPVGQPRPRASTIGGFVRVHEPTSVKTANGRKAHPIVAFKASIKHEAKLAYSGKPLEGPIRLDCIFVFPRPKAMLWKKRPMPRVPHTTKPDTDNITKAVKDALTGIVWRDDSQVYQEFCTKWIASGDEQPKTIVMIREHRETDWS